MCTYSYRKSTIFHSWYFFALIVHRFFFIFKFWSRKLYYSTTVLYCVVYFHVLKIKYCWSTVVSSQNLSTILGLPFLSPLPQVATCQCISLLNDKPFSAYLEHCRQKEQILIKPYSLCEVTILAYFLTLAQIDVHVQSELIIRYTVKLLYMSYCLSTYLMLPLLNGNRTVYHFTLNSIRCGQVQFNSCVKQSVMQLEA